MADEPAPTPTPENVYALLAGKTESQLRRILRSHRDVPFRGEEKYEREAVELRAALDIALDRLMVIEVRLETGSDSVSAPVNRDLLDLAQAARERLQSLHFLNERREILRARCGDLVTQIEQALVVVARVGATRARRGACVQMSLDAL